MHKLKCAFAIYDDLHEFAESWMNGHFSMFPISFEEVGNATVLTLYRSDRYQVQMCFVNGSTIIPVHVHPEADTIEVGVLGAVRLTVNGVDPYERISDEDFPRLSAGRGMRINHDDWHGGNVFPCGTVFLSIQKWINEPKSVLTDYVGEPLSDIHKAMI